MGQKLNLACSHKFSLETCLSLYPMPRSGYVKLSQKLCEQWVYFLFTLIVTESWLSLAHFPVNLQIMRMPYILNLASAIPQEIKTGSSDYGLLKLSDNHFSSQGHQPWCVLCIFLHFRTKFTLQ